MTQFYVKCYSTRVLVEVYNGERRTIADGRGDFEGYICADVTVGTEDRIIFQNGCEAITVMNELSLGEGEDLYFIIERII